MMKRPNHSRETRAALTAGEPVSLEARLAELEARVQSLDGLPTIQRETLALLADRANRESEQRLREAEAKERAEAAARRLAGFERFVADRLLVHPSAAGAFPAAIQRTYREWCRANELPHAEQMVDVELDAAVAGLPGVHTAELRNRVGVFENGLLGLAVLGPGDTADAAAARFEGEQAHAAAQAAERDRRFRRESAVEDAVYQRQRDRDEGLAELAKQARSRAAGP